VGSPWPAGSVCRTSSGPRSASTGPSPTGSGTFCCRPRSRGVLLTVIAALLAFGLTNLVRNTGAALGIAFVYLIILENAVRVMRPAWEPWLLSNNALGLAQQGGYTIRYDGTPDANGFVEPKEYFLGPLQSGIYLGTVTIVVVAIGAVLFARRDLH
jgi:hypothetical protein